MAMHVTLRQLRAFETVADTGSFSEAAKAMSLSQAALSGLVRELESRVGVRLLDRNTRSVALSVVGESFLPSVRRVLATLEEALEGLADVKALRRGVVRVAAPETLSCTLMPDLIATYNSSHADVSVQFEDVPIESVLAALRQGSADIGFGPAGITDDPDLEVHHLWADPLWVALPRDDALARRNSVAWKDLRERQLINYMPNFGSTVLSQVPAARHPARITPVHRVNTALSMLQVRPSAAVVCPSMAEPLVQGFGLAFLPLRQPQVSWQVAMYVRRRPSISPAVESFVRFTQDFAGAWAAMGAHTGRAA